MFGYALRSALTLGKSPQNFLGARWIPAALKIAPAKTKPPLALRLLSLSPHYFYGDNGEVWLTRHQIIREDLRNRSSRALIIKDVVAPYLKPDFTVIDYGCGPGYLAIAAAELCKQVIA